MSQPTTAPATPAKPAEGTPAAPAAPAAPAPDESALGDPGKAALDRMKAERDEAKRSAAAAKEAAEKWAAHEASTQTEAEKNAKAASEANAKAAELELRVLRYDVAAEKGLPAAKAKRLIGSTREELEADADEMLAEMGAAGAPAPRPTNGNAGTQGAAPPADMNVALRSMFQK